MTPAIQSKEKIKKMALRKFALSGEYDKLLALLEDKGDSTQVAEALQPVKQVANAMLEGTKSEFFDEMRQEMDAKVVNAVRIIVKDIEDNEKKLHKTLEAKNEEKNKENLKKLQKEFDSYRTLLEKDSEELVNILVENSLASALPDLVQDARLTEQEKEDLANAAALSLESQVPSLISSYLEDQEITTDDVLGLENYVKTLIPEQKSGGGGVRLLSYLQDVDVSGLKQQNGKYILGTDRTTGWGFYRDDTYTEASPLVIDTAIAQLTNDGAGSLTNTTYLPSTGALLDNDKIVMDAVGDTFTLRVDFKAKGASNDTFFDIKLDIGDGTPIVIVEKTLQLVKGANVEHTFSETFSGFSLNTFIANGCKVMIDTTEDTLDLSIYDIGFLITKTV